jgi:hypothetical protein
MRAHGFLYTGADYHIRFGIFLASRRLVREFNSGRHSFTLSLNHLSCLTPAEYRALISPLSPPSSRPIIRIPSADPPDSWDWRDQSVVVPVQDQGACAAAGAFAAVNAQAGQWAITHSDLMLLSAMAVIECGGSCDGPMSPAAAYDFAIANWQGHFTLTPLPNCTYDPGQAMTTISAYAYSPQGDETSLRTAVYANGLAAVGVDASGYEFQLYTSGICNPSSCSSTNLNHNLLLVGYGSDSATAFWILQNEWGAGWGEKGYIRLIRDAGNKCGVATSAIFPIDPL